MSSTKKLLWLALASFIAIKTPAWADIEGTRLGAYIAILGTTVLFISLISAAVTALIARKQRRSTPQAVQYGGYPPAGPPDLPR